jgi:hypothetical protein
MIQRIQSIWLLLASVASLASMKLAFYSGIKTSDAQNPNAPQTYTSIDGMYNILMNINTVAIGLICLIAIFLFKNRKLQMQFSALAIVLESLLILQYQMTVSGFSQGNYAIGAILQPLVMFLLLMAIRGINKDNKLIQESDRLR